VIHPPQRTALVLREIGPFRQRLEAFEALRGRAFPWLLDSALPSPQLGRFSFAGADPYLVLRVRGARIELECRRAVHPGLALGRRVLEGDFFETVRALLPRLPPATDAAELPFVGGAVVALGYELAQRIEALDLGALDDMALPDCTILFVDRLLAWDQREGRLFASALGFGADRAGARVEAARGARALERQLATAPAAGAPMRARGAARAPFAFFDEGTYGKAVELVKEEIAAGNVYQACLTHRLERDYRGDPWELYRALRCLNPAPFACYLELPEVILVGSSPERFLRLGPDRCVESRPIKGTRPRGRDAAEDAANRAALAASPKERAENLMIVDLVRNDLGRVCETGSIEVPELMAIEEYASVFQMVSTVSGRLRGDRDALDLLRATFPPGSMTGAPKIAAMQLLGRLEPVRRGIYSGAIGYLDARGGADLSVVIRTLLLREGRAYVHAGGGIVADSEPRVEWQETLDKARPLLAALREAEGGS
jgi:para-aminobenzoate synthetase component 1